MDLTTLAGWADSCLVAANRVACACSSKVADPLPILVYHRVHRQPDELFPGEPDAHRFDRMMRYVAHTYRVMTLADAVDRLMQGDLPSRSLVITFDDGYADNEEQALPILRRYGLVATFFVASGFLDGGRMWNDSVVEAIRACRQPEVDLTSFGLGKCSLAEPADRRKAIALLLPRIKYLPLADREQAALRLQSLCRVRHLPSDLMMRCEQVRRLHSAGMEVGAHTVNHPILTTLAPADVEYEIDAGKKWLEGIIDAPVEVFAYPNGRPGKDYDESHVALLRRLGFKCAVTTSIGVAQFGCDVFQLPRFGPGTHSLSGWALRLLKNQLNTRYPAVGEPVVS